MENGTGIYPTFDKVLVRTVEIEEKTSGGLVIPMTTKDKEDQAQVHGILMAMGPVAAVSPEMDGVKIGDMIIHAKYAGLMYRGKDKTVYRIMRASDVVGRTDEVYDKNFRASVPMTA